MHSFYVSGVRRRFTLIELLVVVAIIVILAGMLMPVLTKARKAAHRTSCVNHHKQLGIAITMYGDDNDGSYPYTSYPSTNESWTVSIKPYVNDLRFYQCPSDLSDRWESPVAPPTSNYYTTSYILNAWVAANGDYGRMANITNPSAMIIMADANTSVAQRDHFHPFYWVNDPDRAFSGYMNGVTWDAGTSRTKELDLERHMGRFGSLFADGHVDHVAWKEVWWQNTAARIYQGNFDPRQ